jgi:branched-chain amino acid transport system substrate-binding protein
VAGQILPTFAYRDVDHVRFLGPSVWNSSELVTRAQAQAEDAVFVDAFLTSSDDPLIQEFTEKYKKTFNEDPGVLDATAYDAARILSAAISESNGTRAGVLNELKDVNNYPGVTGKISYRDGEYYRDLRTFTIKQGKITPGQ